jgi:very-long-chain enoyl-CoA reductase
MSMDKNRIKLTINAASITTMDQLLEHLPNGTTTITVTFKDLGPQISWKLVFMIESLGPIIHSFLFQSSLQSNHDYVEQHSVQPTSPHRWGTNDFVG